MAKSGIVWDEKTLAEYLKDPKGRVPGNKMVFIGLKQEAQQQVHVRPYADLRNLDTVQVLTGGSRG